MLIFSYSISSCKPLSSSKQEYGFAKDQSWYASSKKRLSFIDETLTTKLYYDLFQEDESETQDSATLYERRTTKPKDLPKYASPAKGLVEIQMAKETYSIISSSNSSNAKRRKLDHNFPAGINNSVRSNLQRTKVLRSGLDPYRSVKEQSKSAIHNSRSNIINQSTGNTKVFDRDRRNRLDASIWSSEERQEAYLMRYYVDKIAICLDICYSSRHFALVVPQRAVSCPILLKAVFAAAARHLSRVTDFDPLMADPFHQECLRYLVPTLNSNDALMDENLLAAVVILRYLEEIEGKELNLLVHSKHRYCTFRLQYPVQNPSLAPITRATSLEHIC